MDNGAQTNGLIVKTTLELLQHVLPTNIMVNLEQMEANSNGDTAESANDLDEDRFLFERFSKNWNAKPTSAEGAAAAAAGEFQEPQFVAGSDFDESGEQVDNNLSLTYYEIVEQEMMKTLPVTPKNITVFISSDFSTTI